MTVRIATIAPQNDDLLHVRLIERLYLLGGDEELQAKQ